MWNPPWARPYALGALGLASARDRVLADQVAAAVLANISAGRPFYDPVPQDFKDKFQQIARGIYRYVLYHKELMPKGLRPDEREVLAVKIVNKTYYNALRGITGFRGEASLKGWIYKIARNTLIDELRMYLRSAEGKAREKQYSRDVTGEAETAKALKMEMEAIEQASDFELSDSTFRAIESALAEIQRVRHDVNGQEFLSPKDTQTLLAYLKSRGQYGIMAAELGVTVSAAQERFEAAAEAMRAAGPRIRAALEARGGAEP